MALPSLLKTWQFNVNQLVTATGAVNTDGRAQSLIVKNTLTGYGTLPFTMRYSCNSTTAGTAGDGVDRLTAAANFIGAAAGTAHSWYVIRLASLGANVELCFDFTTVNMNICAVIISYGAGFTGGTTTARPTATDEQVLNAAFTFHSSSAGATRVHGMHANDGTASRLLITDAAGIWGYIEIQIPANAVSGWSPPVIAGALSGSGGGSSPTALAAAQWGIATGFAGFRSGSNGLASYGSEGNAGGLLSVINASAVANEIDGSWPMVGISIIGITSGLRGRHGSMVDLWMGGGGVPTGDTYPIGTSYQFAQFGQLIVPWSGVVPVLS